MRALGPDDPHRGPALRVAAAGAGADAEIRAFARGGVLTLVGAGLGSALGFAFVVMAARGLRAEGAGALFEAMAVFMIVTTVARLGADTGLVRELPRLRVTGRGGDAATTVAMAVAPVAVLGIALATAMFLGAGSLARLLVRHGDPNVLTDYLRVMAPCVPVAAVGSVLLAATRGFGRLRTFVVVTHVVIPGLRPVLLLAALLIAPAALWVGLAWTVPFLVGLVPAVTVVRRLLRRWRLGVEQQGLGSARPAAAVANEFWRFAGPRGVATIFQVAMLWLDILLVGALASVEDAAIYTAANRYVVAGTLALNAASLVIAPQVSGLLAGGRRREAQDLFQTATWWLMAASWPLYLSMAVFAPLLMGLFGPDFERGATALALLAVAMLVLMGTGNNKVVLLMAGGSGINMVITASSLVANVGANLLLIPRYGMLGAAIAWTVSILLDNVATTVALWWRVGLSPFGPGYTLVGVAALACFGVGGTVMRSAFGGGTLSLIFFGLLAAVPYSAILWRNRTLLRLGAFRSLVRARVGPTAPPTIIGEMS